MSNGATVTASPGMYILLGGGLQISGGSTLNGTGVTFFNMDGGTYGGYKPLAISGTSSTSLIAPTSGPYTGLLFWQDPNLPSGFYNQQNAISGTSSTVFQGVLYFPNSPLVYSGQSTNNAAYTIMVADTLTFSGGAALNSNFSSLSGGNPIKTGAIVAE